MLSIDELLAELPRAKARQICNEPLAWAEALLVAPATGKPFVANSVQHQILRSPHRYNVIRVHRRAGKSFSMAVLALFYCLMHKNIQVLLVCPRGSQVNEIFLQVKDFIASNPWIEPYVTGSRQALPQQLRFSNGSRFTGFTTGAKGGAASLRGQGGDVVLVDEGGYIPEDAWAVINPIIQGDEHRRWPPKAYIASTPAYTRGHYYDLCTAVPHMLHPDGSVFWHQIYVPITLNPSVDDSFREECRALCATDLDWLREYMCEFPELGEGVFPKVLVDQARRPISYDQELARALERASQGDRPPSRTMGVDWDKYNADGRGPNLLILEATDAARYRVIYRQEIPQTQFSLSTAVQRIVELNEIFQPEWIYLDRGYGDMQLEELQLWGKKFPRTGLAEKTIGIQFAQTVEMPLPGGTMEKKRFKQVMVQLMRHWFERGKFDIAATDEYLYRELIEYHVVGQTEANIKYSEENDHAIAALGLASMAMHQRITNPYRPPPPLTCYLVPQPIAIPRSELARQVAERHGRPYLGDPEVNRSFARRSLGSQLPPPRTRF